MAAKLRAPKAFILSIIVIAMVLIFGQNCSKSEHSKVSGVQKDSILENYKKNGTCLSASAPAHEPAINCPSSPILAADLLTSDHVTYTGNCNIQGDLNLSGQQFLAFENAIVQMNGNLTLSDSSILSVQSSTFNLANTYAFQYRLSASDNSILDIRDSILVTNYGSMNLSLSSSFDFYDDAIFRLDTTSFNKQLSWVLLTLYNRATFENRNTNDVPTEIYPQDQSTIVVCGPQSGVGIWLKFTNNQKADLSDIPSPNQPFTYQFGRNTPSKTNVSYRIYILDGHAGFSISTYPGSQIEVRNNVTPVTFGYYVTDSDQAITLEDLPFGDSQRYTLELTDLGRSVVLENGLLTPMAWQIYAENLTQALTLNDSFVNELAAINNAIVNANNIDFYFAVLAAMGPSTQLNITNSRIESQLAMAATSGQLKIQDSIIKGTVVQANHSGLVLLYNNQLQPNERNPFAGIGENVRFVVNDNGLIVVANINTLNSSYNVGSNIPLTGDVKVVSNTAADTPANYGVVLVNSSNVDVLGYMRNQYGTNISLGSLNTAGLPPGAYKVQLRIPVRNVMRVVERSFVLQ